MIQMITRIKRQLYNYSIIYHFRQLHIILSSESSDIHMMKRCYLIINMLKCLIYEVVLMKVLRRQTEQLKKYIDQLKERYELNDPPKDIRDKSFFLTMKDETEEFYKLLETWKDHALEIIKNRKINVHPHQIISTTENIELLILHSYYIDARRKRYMELNKSCHYIFDQILRGIH